MIIEFRQARVSDARAIVPRLRERDLAGLQSMGDPVGVIAEALQGATVAFSALADGEVAVMFGLRRSVLLDDRAYLWMLGTGLVDEYPVHFLRYSRAAVKLLLEHYRLIYGECRADYERSIRWLTWLGGKVWAPDAENGGRLVFVIAGACDGA